MRGKIRGGITGTVAGTTVTFFSHAAEGAFAGSSFMISRALSKSGLRLAITGLGNRYLSLSSDRRNTSASSGRKWVSAKSDWVLRRRYPYGLDRMSH